MARAGDGRRRGRCPRLSPLFVSAISNLSTSYNLVVINVVHVVVAYQYCGGLDGCTSEVDAASTACLVGAILGQLGFGYIGDVIGRDRALNLTMALSVLGALASAFAFPLSSARSSIFVFLSVTRFFLGVGVGGVYPLSATIASEASAAHARGRNASLVFSMQGVAALLVPLIAWLLLALFGIPATNAGGSDTGLAWRLALGIGAAPGLFLAAYQGALCRPRESGAKMLTSGETRVSSVASESPLPTESAAGAPDEEVRDARGGSIQAGSSLSARSTASPATPASPATLMQALRQPASPATLMQALRQRRYWGKLVGTAGTWFLFDITFFGNQLFQPTVLAEVFSVERSGSHASPPLSGFSLAHNLCLQMAFIGAIALPGYYVSVCLMDRLGRRQIQLQGFGCMALAFAALALLVPQLERSAAGRIAMLILYACTFFFSNFGPNATTFMLPAESFPRSIRSSLNGFSAAMGKTGATLGSALFTPLENVLGLRAVMLLCAAISICGMCLTCAFVEDMRGKSPDEDEVQGGLVPNEGGASSDRPPQQYARIGVSTSRLL